MKEDVSLTPLSLSVYPQVKNLALGSYVSIYAKCHQKPLLQLYSMINKKNFFLAKCLSFSLCSDFQPCLTHIGGQEGIEK